jgi:hypothetical protein
MMNLPVLARIPRMATGPNRMPAKNKNFKLKKNGSSLEGIDFFFIHLLYFFEIANKKIN